MTFALREAARVDNSTMRDEGEVCEVIRPPAQRRWRSFRALGWLL